MDQPRSSLKHARVILVKIGTEVVNSPEGLLAMGKIGSIVEQIARMHMQGKQIILVSSGAVAIGRMVLKRQQMLSGSMQTHLKGYNPTRGSLNPKACAAAGQSGMQSLYEVLFSQFHLACSQILTSDTDFQVPQIRENVKQTILSLLQVGIIPIVNENDVVSQRKVPLTDSTNRVAWDNDSLASLVAQELGAELMLLVTDLPGLADARGAVVSDYDPLMPIQFGTTSQVGPQGQLDKVLACVEAINSGVVKAAVILPAAPNSLIHAVEGQRIGTLFYGPAPLPRPVVDEGTQLLRTSKL
ncbi:hypothetical protein H310_14222 [Aphanomyces invadans]|uniref:Aspartate/glutamate/uridylate kinase domain-containing protein n=1 Tax=Aphanomyces invadans TaxID=157072 RepID=A0A024TAQ4_9STRA|nr:hypothetical protein H310_14222 [Aphanomyces invadans]ETV91128.1 hypothetical protein H310_14222 [Aphanomyces invadans]|eukprot:XP_008880255.1 hypothetical protein H310_14222 [Aphanomyces invadans]